MLLFVLFLVPSVQPMPQQADEVKVKPNLMKRLSLIFYIFKNIFWQGSLNSQRSKLILFALLNLCLSVMLLFSENSLYKDRRTLFNLCFQVILGSACVLEALGSDGTLDERKVERWVIGCFPSATVGSSVCLLYVILLFFLPHGVPYLGCENLTETEMTNRGWAINWCAAGAPSAGLEIPLEKRTLPTLQLLKSSFLHCFDKFFWVNLLTLSHSAFQCLQPFQVFLSVSLRLKRPHTSKRTQLRWNLIQ